MYAYVEDIQTIDKSILNDSHKPAATASETRSWLTAGRVCERRSIRRLCEISRMQRGINACLEQFAYTDRERFFIQLCVDEALVNAVKHGNGEDEDKQVRIECHIDEHQFWIRIEDEGTGFRPDHVPDPRLPENRDRTSGRGVFIMRTYMDQVDFSARGNIVELRKGRSRQGQSCGQGSRRK